MYLPAEYAAKSLLFCNCLCLFKRFYIGSLWFVMQKKQQKNRQSNQSKLYLYSTFPTKCCNTAEMVTSVHFIYSGFITWKRLMSRGFPAFFRQFWLHFRKNLRKNLHLKKDRQREEESVQLLTEHLWVIKSAVRVFRWEHKTPDGTHGPSQPSSIIRLWQILFSM